jgi:predicted glycosyltransferase
MDSRASVIADISHPAHVHFFAAIGAELHHRGIDVVSVGRDKDVTLALLTDPAVGANHAVRSTTPASTPAGQLGELMQRALQLRRLSAAKEARVLLTRNPSGVLATIGTRTASVFDTDDGAAVGVHFWLARPFADVITTGDWMPATFGQRHRRYRGFKALTYLHPDRFLPMALVDVSPELAGMARPLVVIRFSAHAASHDRRIFGLPSVVRRQLLERLEGRATVVLSSERTPGTQAVSSNPQSPLRIVGGAELDPRCFLSVLAAADLCVGDSQSVAAEAAILGVPTIRLSGFTGRAPYLDVLERRYGLMRNLSPGDENTFLELVEKVLADPDGWKVRSARGRSLLLEDCEDIASWYGELVEELLDRSPGGRSKPAT